MALNNSESLKFVPPPMRTLSMPKYATFIPHLASMKTHGSNMSAVKNRINQQCRRQKYLPGQEDLPYYEREYETSYKEFFILESVQGEWFVLYHVPEGTKEEDLPWMRDVWKHRRYGWTYFEKPKYNPDEYDHEKRAFPMDKEEYINWRVRAELEARGIKA